MNSAKHHAEVVELEKKILNPAVRSDRKQLDALITDDFLEFGSSGAVYDKAKIIEALTAETAPLQIDALNFECFDIAKDTVLLTYITRRMLGEQKRETLRSSIWICQSQTWRLRFHQATVKT